MHYLFNSNGECVIAAQSPIEPIDGYTLMESNEVYNPWEIRLIDGKITKQERPKEEPKEKPPNTHTDEPAETIKPTVEELAKSVAGLYGILAEIAPREESEEDTADNSTGKETTESEG